MQRRTTPPIYATTDGRQTAVCDVSDLVDPSGWPEGTRAVIRPQPDHPGAQTTLPPDLDYRFWGHYPDQPGDVMDLDRQIRAHLTQRATTPLPHSRTGGPIG